MRTLERIIPAVTTSDGAGVKLRRSIGARPSLRLDPFLMLDEFGTDNPDDYIAGFPPHPHRGFETVTYMLDGHMRHEDHLGNVGELTAGGVQWMTAGRGVIHSEMPQQKEGRMRGFQLWINLPAREKMRAADYRDLAANELPLVERNGARVKVIAGRLDSDQGSVSGPVGGGATEPVFLDLALEGDAAFDVDLPAGHNAFVYAYEGELTVGSGAAAKPLPTRAAGILSSGEAVRLRAGAGGAGVIVLAGRPLGEPVVQYGPFVMNSQEEIDQALRDYRDGVLV